jgi:hypothetical protein
VSIDLDVGSCESDLTFVVTQECDGYEWVFEVQKNVSHSGGLWWQLGEMEFAPVGGLHDCSIGDCCLDSIVSGCDVGGWAIYGEIVAGSATVKDGVMVCSGGGGG